MLMRTLLSIDPPAETATSDTGWVIGTYSEDRPFVVSDSGVIHNGFQGFIESVELGDWMYELLMQADTVVCEDYVVFNSFGDPSPLKSIGVVQYLRPDAHLQAPSGKNTLVPNKFLKAKGLWESKAHHNDDREAARHAYYWLARNRHKPTLEELLPME